MAQSHGRDGLGAAVHLDAQLLERPRAVLGRPAGAQHQRLDVAVEQLLLAIGQRLEFLEHAIELGLVELEAELLDAIAERVPAAVLAEHQAAARQTDVRGHA